MAAEQKLVRLRKIIAGYNSVLIAFSGGVDSTFLLKVALGVLPKNKVLAVTAISPTYPKEELLFSKDAARELGAQHKLIQTDELSSRKFISNPINRCYFCKSELFTKLKSIAVKFRLSFVADGTSVSDKSDFRPGSLAKQELKIRSPLLEAGFTKEDIRNLSRKMGLSTADKPSLACLASRIPYGTRINTALLKRINEAELYLRNLGFKQVRLRHYDGLCRIEVFKEDIARLISKRDQIVDRLKKLAYNYITVDLEGYRTGSMNPAPSEYSELLRVMRQDMNKKKVRGE